MTSFAVANLLPANPSFAGHQTFAVRSGWLKKGIDALTDVHTGGSGIFTRDDALVTLGVGKNMATSIRHWLLVTRMAAELPNARGRGLEVTPLGQALFGSVEQEGWDSYLEDDTTLWLLHWQLAGPGSLAFSWAWTFSMFREYEFTRDALAQSVLDATLGRVARPLSRETVMRDVDCLLHTYVPVEGGTLAEDNLDCPLQSLGLIRTSYRRHYRFQHGPKKTLPSHIFAYALLTYWEWKQDASASMTVWDAAFAEGSPGMVFKLDEDSVMQYLEEIEDVTHGAFAFEDTALTRQVIRKGDHPFAPMTLLKDYYHA
jgi:hypothetical protein